MRKQSPIRWLINPRRILIPVLVGLVVVVWLLYSGFNKEAFSKINWTWLTTMWIGIAILLMGVRDVAYMYRIRVLTSYELSWRRAFDVIFLWEFASAATPSVVGGTPIAIFIMNKEGISVGRSTTIVLITALLDELFYVTMVPILFIFLGSQDLFGTGGFSLENGFLSGSRLLFISSYFLIVIYCIFISIGLFVKPIAIKKLVVGIFSLPGLRRWKEGARQTGDEIIIASKEAKKMPFKDWIKAFVATYFSWTARYLVVNCIIMAFVATQEHLLIYGRQLVMWVIMLISPTPGGSGLAEFAFTEYLEEFIPLGLAATLALLWRLISYYPYLFIGAIILPGWIRKTWIRRKLIKFKSGVKTKPEKP